MPEEPLTHLQLSLPDQVLDLQTQDGEGHPSIEINSLEPSGLDTSATIISVSEHMLQTLKSFKVFVIDSVSSGGKKEFDFHDKVLHRVLSAARVAYTYLKTQRATSIAEFATAIKESSDGDKLLILFLSGDTVLFEFVNFFSGLYPNIESIPQTYFLPFPHGTGNALSNSIHHYNNLDCLKALFEFNPIHLPIYQVESSTKLIAVNTSLSQLSKRRSILFMIVASWALHSSLVYESDKPEMRAKYGAERFKIAAAGVLDKNPIFKGSMSSNNGSYYTFDPLHNKWQVDSVESSQDLSYFLLAAVSNLEKNFQISPSSKIEEDSLRLVAIPHVESDIVMRLMYDAYNHGNHVKDALVLYEPTLSFTLGMDDSNSDSDSLSIICLDGSSWKVSGTNRKLHFSTVNQSFLYILT